MSKTSETIKNKKTLKNKAVATALAVTALVGPLSSTAEAKAHKAPTPKQKATKLAAKLTKELYDTQDYPKGVPVPGILNGSIKFKHPVGATTAFNNPIILVESHKHTQTDKNKKLLDGSWVGIPGYAADGKLVIEPVRLDLSKGNREGAVAVVQGRNTILDGALIYPEATDAGMDALYGFDPDPNSGDNFQKVQIKNEGGK